MKDPRPGFQATQEGSTVAISPLELVTDYPGGGGAGVGFLTDDQGNLVTTDLLTMIELT